MWSKLKAACLHSLTIAWAYLLASLGVLLEVLDLFSSIFDTDQVKDEIRSAIGDPKRAAMVILAIAGITFLARLRSLVWKRT